MGKKISDYVKKGNQFVNEVLSGKVEFDDEYVVSCCEQYKHKLYTERDKKLFDGSEWGLAHEVCWAVETLGFELEPWQVFMLISLFGWKKSEVKNGSLG